MQKDQRKSENNKFIWSGLYDIGLLLHVPAIMSVPVLIIIFVQKEWFSLAPFLAMVLASLITGQALTRFTPRVRPRSERPLSMVVVALSWLFIVVLGSIPFYGISISVPNPNGSVLIFHDFANAFFESMSGFTSTGLSMVPDASKLPASLQVWRSLMEWVGGVGVVLLALLMIKPAEDQKKLYTAEVRNKIIKNSTIKTVQWIWIIYGAYTFLAIILFLIVGMPPWEALNHGLTAISTGGFTVTSDSFAHYSGSIKMAAIFIIFLGAISFHTHYMFWNKKKRSYPFKETQLRTFFACWLVGIILFSVVKISENQEIVWFDYLFEWTSALGTCGFSVAPLKFSHIAFLQLLIVGMIIGGCSGSTTGGVKTHRFVWAVKAFTWRLKTIWKRDRRNISFSYDQKNISEQKGLINSESAVSLILLWIFLLFLTSFFLLIILGGEFSATHVFFDAASALGGVGLSTGVISHSLPYPAKYMFSLLMWMGRLEIMAVMILFSMPNIYLKHIDKSKKPSSE